MSQIHGATVLITGAASGIGRQLALRMADRGARVVLWDINGRSLNAVADEVRGRAQLDPLAAVVDVGSARAVRQAAADAGPVDILVNNAGIISGRTLPDLTDDQIQRTFAVNALALFWTTRAFLPGMIQRGRGHIVTIASVAGLAGAYRLTDYTASKHAAVGFDEALRAELRRLAPAVRTTVVCPFYIDTGMFAGAKTRVPWLLPILKEAYVVDRVIRAIERDRRRLLMPRLVHILPWLRVLPVRWCDCVIDLFGVNVSMDGFTGRQPGR